MNARNTALDKGDFDLAAQSVRLPSYSLKRGALVQIPRRGETREDAVELPLACYRW